MGDSAGEIPVGDEQEAAPPRPLWVSQITPVVLLDDGEALDKIARLMSGVEWDSSLPCEVADVVRATGREIEETG